MAEKFNIEDVRTWLGCSREAGKKVWLDSDFCWSMSRHAIGALPGYFARIMTPGVFYQRLHHVHFDWEQVAYYLVWEFQDAMKKKQRAGERQYTFEALGQFIDYVKTSTSGRLADEALRHLRSSLNTIAYDDQIDFLHAARPAAVSGCIVDNTDIPPSATAAAILEAFGNFSKMTPKLRLLLSRLQECANSPSAAPDAQLGYGALNLMALLSSGNGHIAFLRAIRKEQGNAFNQNTYNSYLRRLKSLWREYLDTDEGRRRYQEFMERYEACPAIT